MCKMSMSKNQPATFLNSPWWSPGQEVIPGGPLLINETATRARAGLLNALSMSSFFILLGAPQIDIIPYVAPFVVWDMVAAATTGLTPLSPFGVIGTSLTMWSPPLWKAASPKRFAWSLGATMGTVCIGMRYVDAPREYIAVVVGICYVLTWLEAAMGFCVGCYMWSLFFDCEDCFGDGSIQLPGSRRGSCTRRRSSASSTLSALQEFAGKAE